MIRFRSDPNPLAWPLAQLPGRREPPNIRSFLVKNFFEPHVEKFNKLLIYFNARIKQCYGKN
jgi:hypothetical protein